MKRAVIVIDNAVEDTEFAYPYYRLQEAGFAVEVATAGKKAVAGKHGLPIAATVDANTIAPGDYDLLVIPGGYESPDRVRQNANVLAFVRTFDQAGKVIASVCHGPWVLVSAGICRGRRMTCYKGCKDDLLNTGAEWIDTPVVVDRHIVTAQHFRDNPEWMKQTLAAYAATPAGAEL